MLIPTIVLAAAMNAATPPPRPPDGTYTYRITMSGATLETSTVVISSKGKAIVVQDDARVASKGLNALATSDYDPATLHQTSYRDEVKTAAGTQDVTAAFTSGKVTLTKADRPVDIPADPSAPLEIVSDNLIGTIVMVPALIRASGAKTLTLAVASGALALVATVDDHVTETRPAGVPASDQSLALGAGGVRQIFWYDPATYVVHDVEIPSQTARLELTSTKPTVSTLTAPAPIVTPVPTPAPHFSSTDVSFPSDDGTRLAGTLTIPERPTRLLPAVVLVVGSGPVDRNEAIGPNAIFLQLSNALSNAGFVVLRYDKRGIGQSGGSGLTATRDDYVADVRAAFNFTRAQRTVDPKHVYLLGHSEGGELVPSVAADDPGVAGLILLAPPALPLSKISLQQALAMNPPNARDNVRRQELAALADIRDGKNTSRGMVWYRSSMDVDPATSLARVRAPVLILEGAADLQVLPKDLPRLVAAARRHNNDVTAHVLADDTHLFMKLPPRQPATLPSELNSYFTVAGRIDPDALRIIITWLRSHAHNA